MTTDFKASQVQTNRVIVTGSFEGDTSNQLLVYSYNADDTATPNQGVIDPTKFNTTAIGTDVFVFVSGSIGSKNSSNSYGITAIGGDLHVSGNFTVAGTYPSGGGGAGENYFWSPSNAKIEASGSLYTSGTVKTKSDVIVTGSFVQGSGASATGLSSMSSGFNTSAAGQYSHAEGAGSSATNSYSHAEGSGCLAVGYAAHAEGNGSFSSANGSHSEGSNTQALGDASHSEGLSTGANGIASHTEGYGTTTTAPANYSHAEGQETITVGIASHAEGLGTIASGTYQHAQGKYNLRNNDFSLFIIGDGTADGNASRSDIVRVNSGTLPGSGSFEVTGTVRSTLGFSGSLTQLTDGRSYLVAGTNVTITSGSSGQVTISSTGGGGGGGDQYWFSSQNQSVYTTGSALFRGPGGSNDSPSDFGTDIFFFVSGSIGSKDSTNTGTAVFGGDVVISGTLYGGSPLKISGSLQQGRQTQAIGRDSHAAGRETEASGSYSYAGGYGTISSGSGQTVVGKFNERNNSNSLFVVGNGLTDGLRKDVLRVNGDIAEWPLGRVEVTGTLAATNTVTAVNLTGSLTQLSSGDPYLIAGSGISITSGSELNGAVKVSSIDWMNVTLGHSDSALSTNTNYIGQFYNKASTTVAPITAANPYVWRSNVTGSIRKVSVSTLSAGVADKALVQIVNMTTAQTKTISSQYSPTDGDNDTNNVVYVLTSSLNVSPNDGVYITYRADSGSQTISGIYNLLIQVSGTNWP